PDNVPFIAKKATVYQALGRLDDADTLLRGFAPQPDGDLVEPIVYQAILRRRPDDAIRLLENLLRRDQAEGSVGRTSNFVWIWRNSRRARTSSPIWRWPIAASATAPKPRRMRRSP